MVYRCKDFCFFQYLFIRIARTAVMFFLSWEREALLLSRSVNPKRGVGCNPAGCRKVLRLRLLARHITQGWRCLKLLGLTWSFRWE